MTEEEDARFVSPSHSLPGEVMNGLSDAEREGLVLALLEPGDDCAHNFVPLFEDVTAIRDAAVAAECERLLARIETLAANLYDSDGRAWESNIADLLLTLVAEERAR